LKGTRNDSHRLFDTYSVPTRDALRERGVCNVILAESILFYFHNVNPTEIYTRLHGRPASSQPAAGQTAQLTGLCVQFSSITAGLCAVLSPDSDSWANFGSRTVLIELTAPKLRVYYPGCAVWYSSYTHRDFLLPAAPVKRRSPKPQICGLGPAG
jgi:hypothetical protein